MRRYAILFVLAAAFCLHIAAAEREVTVENKGAGVTLAGTLTTPSSGAPKALLVLASGSGQQNRDEQIGEHRPFRTIADTLAAHGFATLRMDDRGVGGSGGDPALITTADNASDIASALAFAAAELPGVPLGVLGHSEGGILALKNAPACRFIVTLGCPAWRGDSIIMSQARALTTAMMGRWDAEPMQRALLDVAASDISADEARPRLLDIMTAAIPPALADNPAVKQQLDMQLDALLSPWYREFLRYNPAADIKAVQVPWLALNGEKDFQVLPANLQTIKELNPQADTRLLPAHNHLLQRCSTGYPQEYFSIKEDISPETLALIIEWLDSQLK